MAKKFGAGMRYMDRSWANYIDWFRDNRPRQWKRWTEQLQKEGLYCSAYSEPQTWGGYEDAEDLP